MLQKFDERNRDLIVSVGGTLSHRDQAAVSPFDSAVQGGDAVWEGLRLTNGRIFGLEAHLARLRRSAHALAFDDVPADEEIIAEIRRTLAANGMRDGVHIRLTLTRGVKLTSGMDPRLNAGGPTLIVLAEFKDPVYDLAGITLVTSSVRRPAPDCLDPKIHHNNLLPSILAKIEANAAGADDAVMLDHRGFIAETNATHIFLVLPGPTRRRPTPRAGLAQPGRSWPPRQRRRAPRGSPGAPCCRWRRRPGSRPPSATTRCRSCTTPARCSSPARWAASPRSSRWTAAASATAAPAR